MTSVTGDETFTRFRRKLADRLLLALNQYGKRISPRQYCPLGGCYPDPAVLSPTTEGFRRRVGDTVLVSPSDDDLRAFMAGFDQNIGHTPRRDSPYYELGCLYRARFP